MSFREVSQRPEPITMHGVREDLAPTPKVKSHRARVKHKGKKNWIAGAVKHPGALRATAKAKGLISGDQKLSTSDLGILSHSVDALTRKRAALAKTFRSFN
jgi:hypothetical protein